MLLTGMAGMRAAHRHPRTGEGRAELLTARHRGAGGERPGRGALRRRRRASKPSATRRTPRLAGAVTALTTPMAAPRS